MTTTVLLLLAFVVITCLAVVLYWPRKFSGPLTEHERRTAHRGLHRRSFALVLVTPLATIVGLLLLLPPLVALDVRSHVVRARDSGDAAVEPSAWRVISTEMSTYEWTTAVLCRVARPDMADEAALATAILDAARDGFGVPSDCAVETLVNNFDARDYRSVELTLVDLAARAYLLTEVVIHAGPRLQDPDPWDVMVGTLEHRVLHRVVLKTTGAEGGADRILRLSRARLQPGPDAKVEALALVRGNPCTKFRGALISADDRPLASCTLSAQGECNPNDGVDQRVRTMNVDCGPARLDGERGVILKVDDGETPIQTFESLRVRSPQRTMLDPAIDVAGKLFVDEMQMHHLRHIVTDDTAVIVVEIGDTIMLRGAPPAAIPRGCSPPLDRGPFSWSGIAKPRFPEPTPDSIEIPVSGTVLDLQSPEFDPTTFHAVLYTITWAANALATGTCPEIPELLEPPTHIPAHPLLTAQDAEVAVAGLRRGRETIGLVLLALAVLTLALGLRRSVL